MHRKLLRSKLPVGEPTLMLHDTFIQEDFIIGTIY